MTAARSPATSSALLRNPPSVMLARIQYRRHTRRIFLEPSATSSHSARVQAAMKMPGVEPVQGALADMFVSLHEFQTAVRQSALLLARERLAPHVAHAFSAYVQSAALPRITPLATRWSIIATPSMDAPARLRRTSPDEARLLAAHIVQVMASATDDAARQAQECDFLTHCSVCKDKLAFMLARRQLLKHGMELNEAWQQTGALLESASDAPPE